MSVWGHYEVEEKRRLSKYRVLLPRTDNGMIRTGAVLTFFLVMPNVYMLPWWYLFLLAAAATFGGGLFLVLVGRKALRWYLVHIYR